MLKRKITWLTFALSSDARSLPSFFSSSVAEGSLPQIIGAFTIHVSTFLKHTEHALIIENGERERGRELRV